MLLAGPLSHTSNQYRVSSKFSTFHWICLLFVLLILVGVELPSCIVVTLSWNALTCFLESSSVEDRLVLFVEVYEIIGGSFSLK